MVSNNANLVDKYNEITVFKGNSSVWALFHIEDLGVNLWELDPLRANAYHYLPQ